MTEDQQLKIYARFQLYKFESLRKYSKSLNALRSVVLGMIAGGATQYAVTQYINEKMSEESQDQAESLKEELITAALLYAAIYGITQIDFKLSNPVFGHSFNEQIRISRGKTVQYLQGLVREHYSRGIDIADTSNRIRRTINTAVSVGGLSNALGRLSDLIEQADVAIDRAATGFRGWQSVAMMDSRTTPICASLHTAFYSAQDYKSRGSIPSRPPRHRRCRSQLIRTYGEPMEFSLNDFLRRNDDFAQDFMGKKKYELWQESKLDVKKFTDLAGNRLFTNDELMTKYQIGR